MKNPTTKNFFTDEQLLTFLDAKEAGKSFPDALSATGLLGLSEVDTHTLRSYWDMHSNMMEGARKIAPRMDLVSRIVEKAGSGAESVTATAEGGYSGVASKKDIIRSNNYLNFFMQMNWKIAAPIAVVALMLTALVGMDGKKQPAPLAMNEGVPGGTQDSSEAAPMAMMAMKAAPVEVSGNVDDLVASLTFEADGEMTLLSDTATDATLVTADSQSITDFNTAYDETTF